MPLNKTDHYTILDKEKNRIGEIRAVNRLENWYTGEVKLSLTEKLDQLFKEVEEFIKIRDFAKAKAIEQEIMSHELCIGETGQRLRDIQLGAKKKVYFKVDD